jgi:hypothetical protein
VNDNFISIKMLDGDLKHSHKKHDFGLTVSTKELVFQKPHVNYHIRLEDIISITPFEQPIGSRPVTFHNRRASGDEMVNFHTGMQHYRVYVREAVVHNRSGIFTLGAVQFILPILQELLLAISRYGGLDAIS